MTERTLGALLCSFLPAAVVLAFLPELREAGWLPLGAAIGAALGVILGVFAWRAGKVLSEDK